MNSTKGKADVITIKNPDGTKAKAQTRCPGTLTPSGISECASTTAQATVKT